MPSPFFSDHEVRSLDRKQQNYLGALNGANLYVNELEPGAPLPEGAEPVGLRILFDQLPAPLLLLCGRANHLNYWSARHRFCGHCATPLQQRENELARFCPNCNNTFYPEINPAIIVAVVKNGKILLGHSARFKKKFYSVLAGFVEIGETFEECVKREVKEEVGIEVKNIRYFGSQPWPFPSSLMIGFTAEWASGDIRVDRVELDDADWFGPEDMPPVPPTVSIAGRLIKWYLKQHAPQK